MNITSILVKLCVELNIVPTEHNVEEVYGILLEAIDDERFEMDE